MSGFVSFVPPAGPAQADILNVMFKGFRIGMDVEVVGQIVRTNADDVEGKRITLAR